jgi:hypothetical protein
MKRPSAIWFGTVLLLYVVAKLAWTAAHIPSDPRYLIGKWQVVGIAVLGTVAFFTWYRFMRWPVAIYFLLSAVAAIPRVLAMQLSMLMVLSIAMVVFQGWAGVQLLILKKNEPNQTVHPTTL